MYATFAGSGRKDRPWRRRPCLAATRQAGNGPPLALEHLEDRTVPTVLDPTFGVGGKTTVLFNQGALDDAAAGVAIQSDGKIVLVGKADRPGSDYDFGITRLNPDGSLDRMFGSNGLVVVP